MTNFLVYFHSLEEVPVEHYGVLQHKKHFVQMIEQTRCTRCTITLYHHMPYLCLLDFLELTAWIQWIKKMISIQVEENSITMTCGYVEKFTQAIKAHEHT